MVLMRWWSFWCVINVPLNKEKKVLYKPFTKHAISYSDDRKGNFEHLHWYCFFLANFEPQSGFWGMWPFARPPPPRCTTDAQTSTLSDFWCKKVKIKELQLNLYCQFEENMYIWLYVMHSNKTGTSCKDIFWDMVNWSWHRWKITHRSIFIFVIFYFFTYLNMYSIISIIISD